MLWFMYDRANFHSLVQPFSLMSFKTTPWSRAKRKTTLQSSTLVSPSMSTEVVAVSQFKGGPAAVVVPPHRGHSKLPNLCLVAVYIRTKQLPPYCRNPLMVTNFPTSCCNDSKISSRSCCWNLYSLL